MIPEPRPIRRVMEPAEASELVGSPAPKAEPSFSGAAVFTDAQDGAAVLAVLPMPELDRFRATLRAVDHWNNVYRAHTGTRNKSQTFGYRPRKPMMRGEACTLSAFGRDRPAESAYLAHYAEVMAAQLASVFPAEVERGRAAVAEVLPEWRLSADSLWTSGVINKESALPYHRDGNNFDAWSVMPVIRRGVRGGHLHIPEYDLTVPCRDGYSVMFFGRRLVHGVTPMRKTAPDAYRISVVFYALKGLKDCHSYAEETAAARVRRTEREDRLGAGGHQFERFLTRDTRPSPGQADRRGGYRNPTPKPLP